MKRMSVRSVPLYLFLMMACFQGTGGAQALSPEERAKILEAANDELYRTEWKLTLLPMWGPKEARQPIEDTLELLDGKLRSDFFADEGFEDSNVSVMVQDDGMVVVETMQRNKKDGVVFWRGELTGGVFRGVISKQVPEQEALSYSFKAVSSRHIEPKPTPTPTPTPTPEPSVEAAAAVSPVEAPAAAEGEALPPETPAAPAEAAVEPPVEQTAEVKAAKSETKPAAAPKKKKKKKAAAA